MAGESELGTCWFRAAYWESDNKKKVSPAAGRVEALGELPLLPPTSSWRVTEEPAAIGNGPTIKLLGPFKGRLEEGG